MQSDLIGIADGVNTYTYVGNNSLIYTDPSGLCAKHPENPKCKAAIMRPEIIGVIGAMANDLKINPLFIMSTALQESGWDLGHVYGTNSSSNGKPLNNLFGATYAGGNNIAYPSVMASGLAREKNWGSYLENHPTTIEAYAASLTSNPRHMYNANPKYPRELAARYKQLLKAIDDCGIEF